MDGLCEGVTGLRSCVVCDGLEAKGACHGVRLIRPTGKLRILQGVRMARNREQSCNDLPAKQAEVMEVMRKLGRDVSLDRAFAAFRCFQPAAISWLRKKGNTESAKIDNSARPCFRTSSASRVTLTSQQQAAVDAI